jgi:hypothetical protein
MNSEDHPHDHDEALRREVECFLKIKEAHNDGVPWDEIAPGQPLPRLFEIPGMPRLLPRLTLAELETEAARMHLMQSAIPKKRGRKKGWLRRNFLDLAKGMAALHAANPGLTDKAMLEKLIRADLKARGKRENTVHQTDKQAAIKTILNKLSDARKMFPQYKPEKP